MKNILITGASGMLGATLANYFRDFNIFGTAILNTKKLISTIKSSIYYLKIIMI